MEFILLRRFTDSVEAHIVKGMLENEGIECYIKDDNMNSMMPIYNVALGGIKLMVRHKDLDQANELLKENDIAPYTDEEDKEVNCPKCGSNQLIGNIKGNKGVKGFFLSLFSFLVASYPMYNSSLYICQICGNKFEAKS